MPPKLRSKKNQNNANKEARIAKQQAQKNLSKNFGKTLTLGNKRPHKFLK